MSGLRSKHAEFELAAALRRRGLSYSEIQAHVSVSQATLSLWLRDIPLTDEQRKRLAGLKVRGAQAGVAAIRQAKRMRVEAAQSLAIGEGRQRLDARDIRWVVGVVLYLAEGSKVKPWRGRERVAFTNMDPRVIKLFQKWLVEHAGVTRSDLSYELYVHPTTDTDRARQHWAQHLCVSPADIRVYFKRANPSPRRRNVGNVYYGVMRLSVRRSTMLLHRIDGWIRSTMSYCGVG